MIESELQKYFQPGILIQATACSPKSSSSLLKVSVKPVMIKHRPLWQFTYHYPNKATHSNYTREAAIIAFHALLTETFEEAHLFTNEADLYYRQRQGRDWSVRKTKPSKTAAVYTHNREKKYLLSNKAHAPFWHALGIADPDGRVRPAKQAKFRQVNRFLELVNDILPQPDNGRPLNIFDFGCGKAYLTFGLAHFLKYELRRSFTMTGVDLKADVIADLEKLRKVLNYDTLNFICCDLNNFSIAPPVDLVISLHACDTATDIVLAKAITAEAKMILSVPCCQHELYSQIQQPLLQPLLKHGTLKERFAALATDAARASILENHGYETQVIEFIDMEHTPKNILIRAIKTRPPTHTTSNEYISFTNFLSIKPKLQTLLHSAAKNRNPKSFDL